MVIGLDWLQLHCKRNIVQNIGQCGIYTCKKLNYQTRIMKSVYEIFVYGERCGTIACDPHSGILKKETALLKIENKFLYRKDITQFVASLLTSLQFTFISFSRIDTYCDFQHFTDYHNPEKFIHSFLDNSALKKGQSKFKVQGEHTNCNSYSYLKFGSETSEVSYYLYNKSKELREVKMKPWIYESWKDAGFTNDIDSWRLEFSLKSSVREIVNLETGEVNPVKDLRMTEAEFYKALYTTLYQKYFSFVVNDGQKRKDRMKPIDLLDFGNISTIIMRLSDKIESNRSHKIFLKQLYNLNQTLRGTDFEWNIHHKRTLNHYIEKHALHGWVIKNQPEIAQYLN